MEIKMQRKTKLNKKLNIRIQKDINIYKNLKKIVQVLKKNENEDMKNLIKLYLDFVIMKINHKLDLLYKIKKSVNFL